jgi:hypothetical protein
MSIVWKTTSDDNLALVVKTVEFLQEEFCPAGADRLWSVDYFLWKLGPANPAGTGLISLATVNERVVGVVSLTKKRILIDGVESIGGEVGDSYSAAIARRESKPAQMSKFDPDPQSYINKSIFGRLASDVRARAEAQGISLIYGTPNANAYPGWVNRLGFFDFTQLGIRSYSRPTSAFLLRRYPQLKVFSGMLRGVEMSLSIIPKIISPIGPGRQYDMTVGFPNSQALEDLWERVKPKRGFSLVRDARYWEHRFSEHPIANYAFLCFWKGGELVGLVVTRVATIAEGRRVCYLVEWMNTKTIKFTWVLTAVMDFHKDSGVEMYNLWAPSFSSEAKASSRKLFFSKHSVPIILADNGLARKVQCQATDFQFYLASSDAV